MRLDDLDHDRQGTHQLRAEMAEHFADFRQGTGLSRLAFATLAGLTLQELDALEGPECVFTVEVLGRLSKFLDSLLDECVPREKTRFQ